MERKVYCTNCGKEINEHAKFCQYCGSEVDKDELLNAGQAAVWTAPAPAARWGSAPAARSSRQKWIVIISIIMLAALVGAFLIWYMSGKRSAEYNSKIVEADQYMQELDYEKAETAYLEAIDIAPKQEEAYLKVVNLYIGQEQYEAAEDILTSGQQKSGGSEINNRLERVQAILDEDTIASINTANYTVVAERKVDNVFTKDHTEILVRTEVDVPRAIGNDALNTSVKAWACEFENQAEELRNSCTEDEYEGMETYQRADYNGTEYPVYVSSADNLYVPDEEDDPSTMPRTDDKVLSLLYQSHFDGGGPHGFDSLAAGNFDVVTGEQITLKTITNDYEEFSTVMLSCILNELENLEQSSEFVDDYVDTVYELWNGDDMCWYMNQNGFVFYFDQYVLASYATGPSSVEVPYEDVSAYMKPEYVK